jgi:hypothetical protein
MRLKTSDSQEELRPAHGGSPLSLKNVARQSGFAEG